MGLSVAETELQEKVQVISMPIVGHPFRHDFPQRQANAQAPIAAATARRRSTAVGALAGSGDQLKSGGRCDFLLALSSAVFICARPRTLATMPLRIAETNANSAGVVEPGR